jgi:hypothetical protein
MQKLRCGRAESWAWPSGWPPHRLTHCILLIDCYRSRNLAKAHAQKWAEWICTTMRRPAIQKDGNFSCTCSHGNRIQRAGRRVVFIFTRGQVLTRPRQPLTELPGRAKWAPQKTKSSGAPEATPAQSSGQLVGRTFVQYWRLISYLVLILSLSLYCFEISFMEHIWILVRTNGALKHTRSDHCQHDPSRQQVQVWAFLLCKQGQVRKRHTAL